MRHGHANKNNPSPEYRSWQSMIQRCTNPNATGYEKYGARGVKVYWLWRESFPAFLRHVGARPPGTSLDRIDGSKGYVPGNIRWADARTQNQNRSNAHLVTINGETACVTEWARRIGVTDQCILARVRRGQSGKQLLRPSKRQRMFEGTGT